MLREGRHRPTNRCVSRRGPPAQRSNHVGHTSAPGPQLEHYLEHCRLRPRPASRGHREDMQAPPLPDSERIVLGFRRRLGRDSAEVPAGGEPRQGRVPRTPPSGHHQQATQLCRDGLDHNIMTHGERHHMPRSKPQQQQPQPTTQTPPTQLIVERTPGAIAEGRTHQMGVSTRPGYRRPQTDDDDNAMTAPQPTDNRHLRKDATPTRQHRAEPTSTHHTPDQVPHRGAILPTIAPCVSVPVRRFQPCGIWERNQIFPRSRV